MECLTTVTMVRERDWGLGKSKGKGTGTDWEIGWIRVGPLTSECGVEATES